MLVPDNFSLLSVDFFRRTVNQQRGSNMDAEKSSTSQKTAKRRLPASVRGRGSGPLARGRVLKRGLPRRRARGARNAARNLQAEREAAAATALERKKEEMRAAIHNLTEDEVRDLFLRTVEKEPSLMFEVLTPRQTEQVASTSDEPGGSVPAGGDDQPWCSCSFCREMPQPEENLCCGKQPESCLSRLAQFQLLVLDEDVLDIARLYCQDVLAVPAEDDRNRGRRHAGYRQFTLWQHGRLGAGNRRVIPSCCVWSIRTKFPDRFGQYTGFISGRLG